MLLSFGATEDMLNTDGSETSKIGNKITHEGNEIYYKQKLETWLSSE